MLKTLVNYSQSIFLPLSPKAITNLYLLFKIQMYCAPTAPVEKENDYEWCRIQDLWWGFDFMWFVGALEEVGAYCLCIWAWSHCWLVELAVRNTNQMQSEVKWEQKGTYIHPSLPPILTMMVKWKELLPLAMELHACLPWDWEVEGGVVGLDVVPCQQDEHWSDHRMHGCGGPWHPCWPLEKTAAPKTHQKLQTTDLFSYPIYSSNFLSVAHFFMTSYWSISISETFVPLITRKWKMVIKMRINILPTLSWGWDEMFMEYLI